LDDLTHNALKRRASGAKRKRTQIVPEADIEVSRKRELNRMYEAYKVQPDCDNSDDDWSNWEDFSA